MSKEHILPESLGNSDYFLNPGWVCDKCNNYLSRKVEAPFLNSEYGKRSRFEMTIPSKRGRIPVIQGIHPRSRTIIDFIHDGKTVSFCASDKSEEIKLVGDIRSKDRGTFYIPMSEDPIQSYETSRFIGMVALEVLAYRGIDIAGWNEEVVNKTELDELRSYVRYGKKGLVWPIHIRRIYQAQNIFNDGNMADYQVLNEWDILFLPTDGESNVGEFYVVLAILGVEYAINLGGPELGGYLEWLKQNNEISYLYSGKNA